ncbi:MAG: hypothetical protein GX851_04240, partial [Clostridiales bacterium]|nr:hypothetical protein [Clostridiales bacterium]
HGTAAGHFNGDECLAGKSPVRGSECCSVAEAMYSYEWLVSVTGNPYWAERLEKNAFNSFPATLAPDMWSHQYDQQANQINCCATETDKVPFGTNNGEAHTFGLMPHCSCCLANHNQGWPKFTLNIFQKSENGFAVTAIAPAKLTAEVNGAKISAELITDYPFEDGYRLKIRSDSAVSLDITLRVPEKATNAQIDGERADTGFNTVRCNMNGEKEISVNFDFDIELNSRDNDLFSVSRGNLTFALPIEGRWEKREYSRKGVERKFPYCDYDLSPLSKWNYALYGKNFTLERSPVGDVPFSPEGAPLKIKARFVPIDWKTENGMCTEVPGGRTPLGEPETLFMIPYGCTNLRMTEMPLKAQGADSRRPV